MNSPSEQINIWPEEEGFCIRHEPTGVTTQGDDRIHALMMLSDALAAYNDSHSCKEMMEMSVDTFIMSQEDREFLEELENE